MTDQSIYQNLASLKSIAPVIIKLNSVCNDACIYECLCMECMHVIMRVMQ